jgi:ribosomal protein S18 acetylase RimI-like enzyme
MQINIELGNEKDIDEIENLYDELNDYLADGINYPGWKKGTYPTRQNAIDGIMNKTLFAARHKGKVIGTIILNHEPEPAYYNVKWLVECDYSEVIVIHTFAVHPEFMKCGIGNALMDFAYEYSIKSKAKSIRLDVFERNIPAINLYEKCGFQYIDTVDLGYRVYGLDAFELYEKLV